MELRNEFCRDNSGSLHKRGDIPFNNELICELKKTHTIKCALCPKQGKKALTFRRARRHTYAAPNTQNVSYSLFTVGFLGS